MTTLYQDRQQTTGCQFEPAPSRRVPATAPVSEGRAAAAEGPCRPSWPARYAACKAAADYAIGAILLVLFAPVILAAILLVRLTSRGPAIYSQTRLGRGGRPFVIYKLRTMRHDCERLTGAQWSTAGDPRVTPLGRFLRKTHLDELPQLWNVLRGEMSLVGPRPERPEIVGRLEQAVPGYRDREAILPGVTGLAQVQLPPDTTLDDVRHKLALDRHYIENASLWLDLRITVCTALKVFLVPCSMSCAVLGIPSVTRDGKPAPVRTAKGNRWGQPQPA